LSDGVLLMFNLLLANSSRFWHMNIWYAVPAIIAISLVYAATRHEKLPYIFAHAVRMALWIVGFMFAVFVVLQTINWWIGH
jgi:hypothetical protein